MTGAWPSWPRPPIPARSRDPLATGQGRRQIGFAGERAARLWGPRLDRLADAVLAVEIELLRRGALAASLLWCPHAELAPLLDRLRRAGLASKLVDASVSPFSPAGGGAAGELGRVTYGLLIGAGALEAAAASLAADDQERAARWFGYPACCARAWAARQAAGAVDPLAAVLSPAVPSADILLAGLGLGPLRHAPCDVACPATAASMRQFLDAARDLDLGEAADWLEAMADWPVEMSVVSGVAEVKTAVFRFAYRSDPLAAPRRCSSPGRSLPEAASSGHSSVFARSPTSSRPESRPESRKSLRIEPEALGAGWEAAGFDDVFALRSRWSTAVWEQGRALRRKPGRLVHLGCGDGLLLELAGHGLATAQLVGVEPDPALAAAARDRLRPDRGRVIAEPWSEALDALLACESGESLAFFDPLLFADMAPDLRTACLDRLRRLQARLIVVASDRGLRRFGSLERLARSIGLGIEPDRPHRISSPARFVPAETGAAA